MFIIFLTLFIIFVKFYGVRDLCNSLMAEKLSFLLQVATQFDLLRSKETYYFAYLNLMKNKMNLSALLNDLLFKWTYWKENYFFKYTSLALSTVHFMFV